MSDDGLESDRALLDRASTAEKVAEILRTRIIQGYFKPGARLVEGSIDGALGVSRNTLREAFRLLTHEGLLAHELNRGVFVRVPSVDDVVDIYRVRKLVECGAARQVRRNSLQRKAIQRVVECVQDGEDAAGESDWLAVGTADIRFHQAVAALAGSERVDDVMRRVLAELRLVFHVMADPRRFHEAYLPRNREIADVLGTGSGAAAARMLAAYLDDAERQLVHAYRPKRRDLNAVRKVRA
ncbi:MAG: GntR family transcriptional regulator [Acidothermales bacterium]|nr:GntR family transcriptional regulator [Acidothermales bacterium]